MRKAYFLLLLVLLLPSPPPSSSSSRPRSEAVLRLVLRSTKISMADMRGSVSQSLITLIYSLSSSLKIISLSPTPHMSIPCVNQLSEKTAGNEWAESTPAVGGGGGGAVGEGLHTILEICNTLVSRKFHRSLLQLAISSPSICVIYVQHN